MKNLHRELAPISDAAWAAIETEARLAFKHHVAGRRVVDVSGPAGTALAAVGTGHLRGIDSPADGVTAAVRTSQPIAELRIAFGVDRQAVDDVERGARDTDWLPVQQAARAIASAEDRVVFEGLAAAGIAGIRQGSSNQALALPADPREYPGVVSQALEVLRLAGVVGPYALLLDADAYTAVTGAADHGYPVDEHLARLTGGEVIWAPAITGGFLLSARGGDFELHLGQELSIGYLSHDAAAVQLYFQEALTFLIHTSEAAVALDAAGPESGHERRRG
ncbi:MAG TPA: family 1 encapsulin nanocompartment shell protein [Streptosporangiaceae bacterium]|nr:family 1 encapsulin nanocompartment shell protein [Streptosporangiaceae bacterium]